MIEIMSMATHYYLIRIFVTTLITSSVICGLSSSATAEADYSSPLDAHFRYNTRSSDTSRIDTATIASVSGINNKISFSPHRERRSTKENLCDKECVCVARTAHFVAVQCDLKQYQYFFGSKYFIPSNATSLSIKLASNVRLTIEPDFFYENSVNSILIEGNIENNAAHVEILSNAFQNNRAPFPDIQIHNCHTVILRPNATKGELKLNIANCKYVNIYPNALYSTSFNGNFSDIADLSIQEGAFRRASAKINIYRSYIENVYRFGALHIREIGFFNCTIGNVTGGTFDVLRINVIIFDSCKIQTINTRAITEKLQGDLLTITGGYIGVIESHAIYGSGISEVIFSNNHIQTIQTNAIEVTVINASFTKNRIIQTELAWIHIQDWEKVIISENKFGKFNLMILDKANKKSVTCRFEKNFITRPLPGSLNLTNPHCVIREVVIDRNCSCLNWLGALSSHDLRSETYCNLDDNLKFCFNTTIINVLKFEKVICGESETTLDCVKNRGLKRIDGEFIRPDELEFNEGYEMHYIIGIIVIILIISSVIIAAFVCVRKRRSTAIHTYEGGPTDQYSDGSKISKEDRRIINRTMETVKQKYPQNMYKELDNHVQTLFKRDINETELVQAIGVIVQILNTCENSGDDFVAFTAILGKLLRPNGDTNLDPIYAEPNLPNELPEQTEIEHIYTEPNSVQQPLLNNEYSSPADRHDVAAFYSEPIGKDTDHRIIQPYATVTPKQILNSHLIQQPSTSKNLPDILKQSSANKQQMTNVKQLAQNFSNNKNFHITRSPSTNRRIPKYTIPNVKAKVCVGQEFPSRHSPPILADSGSNHSGSSDITVKIDDIDYADA